MTLLALEVTVAVKLTNFPESKDNPDFVDYSTDHDEESLNDIEDKGESPLRAVLAKEILMPDLVR